MNKKPILLTVDTKYKNKIINSLDNVNEGAVENKERPFYVEIGYSDKYKIFIPLRSNCPIKEYSINIYNDANRKNPGLDFTKMLILKANEALIYSKKLNKPINSLVYQDISKKTNQIKIAINKTIDDYKNIIYKNKNKLDLSKTEKSLLKISTLINYIDFVQQFKMIKIE